MMSKVALVILILARLLQDGRSAPFHPAMDEEENHILTEVIEKLSKYIDYKVRSSIKTNLKAAKEDCACETKVKEGQRSMATKKFQGRTENVTSQNFGAVTTLAREILQAVQNITNPTTIKNKDFSTTGFEDVLTGKGEGTEKPPTETTEELRSEVKPILLPSNGQDGGDYKNGENLAKTTKKNVQNGEGNLSTSTEFDPSELLVWEKTSEGTVLKTAATTTWKNEGSMRKEEEEVRTFVSTCKDQSELTTPNVPLVDDDLNVPFVEEDDTSFPSVEFDPSELLVWNMAEELITTLDSTATWRNDDAKWWKDEDEINTSGEDKSKPTTSNSPMVDDGSQILLVWKDSPTTFTSKIIPEINEDQLESTTPTTWKDDVSIDPLVYLPTKNPDLDVTQSESTIFWRSSISKIQNSSEGQLVFPSEVRKDQLVSTTTHDSDGSSDLLMWGEFSTTVATSTIPEAGRGQLETSTYASEKNGEMPKDRLDSTTPLDSEGSSDSFMETDKSQREITTTWKSENPNDPFVLEKDISTPKTPEEDEGQLETSTYASEKDWEMPKDRLDSTTPLGGEGSSDSLMETDKAQREITTTWGSENPNDPFVMEKGISTPKTPEEDEGQLETSTYASEKNWEMPKDRLDSTTHLGGEGSSDSLMEADKGQREITTTWGNENPNDPFVLEKGISTPKTPEEDEGQLETSTYISEKKWEMPKDRLDSTTPLDGEGSSDSLMETDKGQRETTTTWGSENPNDPFLLEKGISTPKTPEEDEGQLEMNTFTTEKTEDQLDSTTPRDSEGSSGALIARNYSTIVSSSTILELGEDNWGTTTAWTFASEQIGEEITSTFDILMQDEDQSKSTSEFIPSKSLAKEDKGEDKASFASEVPETIEDQSLSTPSSMTETEIGSTSQFISSESLVRDQTSSFESTIPETVKYQLVSSTPELEIDSTTVLLVPKESLGEQGKDEEKTYFTSETLEDHLISSTPKLESESTTEFVPSVSLTREDGNEENTPFTERIEDQLVSTSSSMPELEFESTTEVVPSETLAKIGKDEEKSEPVEDQLPSTSSSMPELELDSTTEFVPSESLVKKDKVENKTETVEDQLTSTTSSFIPTKNGGPKLKNGVGEITTTSTFTVESSQNQRKATPSTVGAWKSDVPKLQEVDKEAAKATTSNVIEENDDESSGGELDPRDLIMWDNQKVDDLETTRAPRTTSSLPTSIETSDVSFEPWMAPSHEEESSTINSVITTSLLFTTSIETSDVSFKPGMARPLEEISSTTNSVTSSDTRTNQEDTETSLSSKASPQTTIFDYEEEISSVDSSTTEGMMSTEENRNLTNGREGASPTSYETCKAATLDFVKTLQNLYEDKTCNAGKTIEPCKCDVLVPIGKPENKIYLAENPETPDVQELYVPILKISKKDKSFQFTEYMKKFFA